MTLLSQRNRPRPFRKALFFFLFVGVPVGIFLLQRELRLPPPAVVEVTSDLPAIGRKGVVKVRVREPGLGLAQVVVTASGAGLARAVLAQVRRAGRRDAAAR